MLTPIFCSLLRMPRLLDCHRWQTRAPSSLVVRLMQCGFRRRSASVSSPRQTLHPPPRESIKKAVCPPNAACAAGQKAVCGRTCVGRLRQQCCVDATAGPRSGFQLADLVTCSVVRCIATASGVVLTRKRTSSDDQANAPLRARSLDARQFAQFATHRHQAPSRTRSEAAASKRAPRRAYQPVVNRGAERVLGQ